MILILMFHRISDRNDSSVYQRFERFLTNLSQRYAIILPGETAPKHKLSICLTFDDAYADFYLYVFPLLQKLKIRAVLGVVPSYITTETTYNPEQRLSLETIGYDDAKTSEFHAQFCTWQEIRTMVESGLVIIASHSMNHCNAKDDDFDPKIELEASQRILIGYSKQTQVDNFIYPYGSFQKKNHEYAQKHYRYLMRIGAALNMSWQPKDQLLYRYDADNLWKKDKSISKSLLLSLGLKYLTNKLRGK